MTGITRELLRAIVVVALFFLSGCAAATLRAIVQQGVLTESLNAIRPDEVTVFRPGVGPITPLPLHLQEGDEIRTGPTTEVLLKFPVAYVLVRPNTHVTVKCLIINGPNEVPLSPPQQPSPQPRPAQPAASDTAGSVLVRALSSGFRLHTDLVDAAVKGTKYSFQLDRNRVVHLVVQQGTVALQSRTHGWDDVLVNHGEAADGSGRAQPVKRTLAVEDIKVLDTVFHTFDVFIDLAP
jgi:hypothetical protein